MKCLETFVAIVTICCPSCLWSQSRTPSEAIASAMKNPNDLNAVGQVIAEFNRTADTGTWLALKALYGKSSARLVRENLALILLQHGEEDTYLDALIEYAREAVDTTAPLPIEYDEQGIAISGHLAQGFQRWCEAKNIELQECSAMVYAYPVDVLMLARAKNRKAIPLLRRALGVENHAVVEMAVRGLAWLGDTDSIPLIARQLTRFRPKLAQSVAAATAEFDDPRVTPLLDRFVADGKLRQELDLAIRKRHDRADR
uniref:PBS lyase HEAT domain protein repeat-containing protein n=1 Tax=Solibacter usitatus (strain Ellin6076) TaxID=234267 RepID=Q01T06_SOLUE